MTEWASVKRTEITWHTPVNIQFGFSGVDETRALLITKSLLKENWPNIGRPNKCVYIIRLSGDFAVQYPRDFSPVIYVGEGAAHSRLQSHAGNWLVDLARGIQGIGVDIRVAEVARKNHATFYQYIEADMLDMFQRAYGSLPWFNQQRETSKKGWYPWDDDAMRDLTKNLGIGSGKKFIWAIQPTKNHPYIDEFNKGNLL